MTIKLIWLVGAAVLFTPSVKIMIRYFPWGTEHGDPTSDFIFAVMMVLLGAALALAWPIVVVCWLLGLFGMWLRSTSNTRSP